jgi:hypothetical protein
MFKSFRHLIVLHQTRKPSWSLVNKSVTFRVAAAGAADSHRIIPEGKKPLEFRAYSGGEEQPSKCS